MARIGCRRPSKAEDWILVKWCDRRTRIAILRQVRVSTRMFIIAPVSQPPLIDIEDLRSPVLTPIQQQALAGAGPAPSLRRSTRRAILGAAGAETGLADFGATDFIDRLDVWLQAIEED